eukprot:2031171-Alexandrium_andersonii.AAC.1
MLREFTTLEIGECIRKIKKGKAPGPDTIQPELLKWASEEALDEVCSLFNSILSSVTFPESWTQAQ